MIGIIAFLQYLKMKRQRFEKKFLMTSWSKIKNIAWNESVYKSSALINLTAITY